MREPTLGARAVAAGLVGVVIAHAGLALVLYRGRVIGRWPTAQSDFVLLAMPLLLASAAIAFLLWRSGFLWTDVHSAGRLVARLLVIGITALGIAFISAWLSMLVPINLYGT